MTDDSDKMFEREAAVFKALGHPTRLRIVKALAGGEKCVCELQGITGGSLSTVSRHLQVLRTAGVLAPERVLLASLDTAGRLYLQEKGPRGRLYVAKVLDARSACW